MMAVRVAAALAVGARRHGECSVHAVDVLTTSASEGAWRAVLARFPINIAFVLGVLR